MNGNADKKSGRIKLKQQAYGKESEIMNTAKYEVKLRDVNFTFAKLCNLRCKMCGYVYQSIYFKGLTTQKVIDTIRDCRDLGCEKLTLSGGEPLTRRDVFDVIAFASSLGINISLNTNGTLIDAEKAEKLVQSGVSTVIVSLEGFEQTNDYIRGRGSFQKAVNALKYFKKFEDKLEHIKVGIVISKYNYNQLYDFTKFLFEEVGINSISYNPFDRSMMGEMLYKKFRDEIDVTADLIPEIKAQLERIIAYSKISEGDFPPEGFLRAIPDYFMNGKKVPESLCRIPLDGCGISGNGTVYPCWTEYRPAGNIAEQSIKEIVNSEGYQSACERALNRDCKGCLSACYMNLYD